ALTSGGDIQDWLITSQTMNTTDGSGNTPLHYAAEWKLDSSILRLVEKGAKINAVNSNGESALFSAVKGNSPATINTLVRAGIETDVRSNLARDHLGNTPLHYAVRWNSLDAAQTLLSMGMEVDAQNLSGKTALSDACRSSKKDMAILLMKNRADINAADATGRTVLMDSISSNNEYMVSLLLSNGANPQIQEMSGRTAYHEAAVGGNINIITKVREAGGNPLSRDSYGDSPFSLVLRSDDKIIRAVLGSNLTIVDSDGNTPVHIAIEKKVNSKILEKILSMGYQVNIRNGKGLTPLNMAVSANQKKNSLILLEHGANPFTATISGDSALTNAFKNGNIEILDAIVKYNAAKTDMQGDSILHYAARLADENICKHLVEAGLDRNARNISGETPAQMAERWNRITIAGILK
ncbi:MAG: ankyrin repeat domain-containing protein, partial [Treponema sp.]|nr:ankyrin repeat domain-containing protein [Treponema sp.]